MLHIIPLPIQCDEEPYLVGVCGASGKCKEGSQE